MRSWLLKIVPPLALLTMTVPAAAQNLVETAENTPEVKMFVEAVQSSGLAESLEREGPYTVFAPADSAFSNLPENTRKELLKNKSALAELLAYHVVDGKMLVTEVRPGKVKTVQGGKLSLESDNGLVKVNGARVIHSDLAADNGVIHIIDSVLQPEQ